MNHSLFAWIGFTAFVILMLFMDLLVFRRKSHQVKFKEALLWSLIWIGLALIFGAGVYYFMSPDKAMEFLTGYVIEKSLSIDNLFVFIMIFGFFQIKGEYQHKILFWGIIGALIFRIIFILLGVQLIQNFDWIMIVFGAFLIFTGVKIPFEKEKTINPEKNILVRILKKFIPVSTELDGNKFFTRKNAKLYATPLFVTLLIIEFSDVIFAVDSIPAVLAVSKDSFIVYTSNVFAILGLRALYFALAGIVEYFHYLKYGLAAILVFVGTKMCLSYYDYHFPIAGSLIIILGILVVSILVSVAFPVKKDFEVEVDEEMN